MFPKLLVALSIMLMPLFFPGIPKTACRIQSQLPPNDKKLGYNSYLTSVYYQIYSIYCPSDSRKIHLWVFPCENTIFMTFRGVFRFFTKGFFCFKHLRTFFIFETTSKSPHTPPPCLRETKYEQILFRTVP